VNVRDAGFPVCVIVSASEASASVAVAVIGAIGLPSAAHAVAGAVIAGCRFTLFTVMTVVAEPHRALQQVKVTV
jgi:hypothetical protein